MKDNFSSLYNSESDTMETAPENSNAFINGDISYNEVEKGVKSLEVNKAAGSDGIPKWSAKTRFN